MQGTTDPKVPKIKDNIQLKFDPLKDQRSELTFIDSMGGDLAIVNSARVSYAKKVETLESKDLRLINFLIREDHKSPLRSTVISMRVRMPLFLIPQHTKHVIASSHIDEQRSHNQESLRYIDLKNRSDFYTPKNFREPSQTNKQGSDMANRTNQEYIRLASTYNKSVVNGFDKYHELIEAGVCKEQARAVLSPAYYTSFIWTVSLEAALHYIDLRKSKNSQWEIQQYAIALEKIVEQIAPNAMKYWQLKKIRQSKKLTDYSYRDLIDAIKTKLLGA